jgi:hypothetical protein
MDEHKFTVFEYKLLKRIFGTKKDLTGKWTKLQD